MKTQTDNLIQKRKALKQLLQGSVNLNGINLRMDNQTFILTGPATWTDVLTGETASTLQIDGMLEPFGAESYTSKIEIMSAEPFIELEPGTPIPYFYKTICNDHECYATQIANIPATNLEKIILQKIN